MFHLEFRRKHKMHQKKTTRFASLFLALIFALPLLTGCERINRDTKIVLTTGFTKDEVFRIETASCYKKEVMVYLTNLQNRYEQVYGAEIWEKEKDGVTIEQSVKESVLAELAQIKTMNLMAEKYGISLEDAEQDTVNEAAKAYFSLLTKGEKDALDVTLDTIRQLYREYALADKVYDYIIKDVNPEISDDEARTVVLQQILVRFARQGGAEGDAASEQQKSYAYARAREVLRRIRDGEDFDVAAAAYSDAEEGTVSVRKGERDAAFEKVAFELGSGEMSGIVEAPEGYYILKCVSTLNREETDLNKVKIVEERKKEAFSREYDSYVQTLTRHMNEPLWQQVSMFHDGKVKTSSFFDVFAEHYQYP